MGIFQLNHAVLFVSELERSVDFYTNVLGFQKLDGVSMHGAAFLRAADSTNDHDLGLFEVPGAAPSQAGRATPGLYHLAWEVDTLDELERVGGVLANAGALVGASNHGTTKSLYGKDPDGLEFEIVWIIPSDLVTDQDREAAKRISPLDLERERARFDGGTRGGVGISHTAPEPSKTPPVASPSRVYIP